MSVSSAARRVARLLRATGRKIVFAESCTGGLVSGALSRIPGISNFLCGGMIVYRNQTKTAYLDVPATILAKPGPVSAQVAELMARRILEKTPEADLAVSVTGHLGPNAPRNLDGQVYSTIAWRSVNIKGKTKFLQCRRNDSRALRQSWVIEQVLELLGEALTAKL